MGLKVKKRSASAAKKSTGKYYTIDGTRIEKFDLVLPAGVKLIRRLQGTVTEMGQFEFRIFLFQVNEMRFRARKKGDSKVMKPFTDDTLGELMAAEFPTGAACHYQVQTARRQYNEGVLTKGVEPQTKSKRYDASGDIVAITRGRPSSDDSPPTPKSKKKKTGKKKKKTKTPKK